MIQVPDHKGTEGNDTADQLTKLGSEPTWACQQKLARRLSWIEQGTIKMLGVLKRTQTTKEVPKMALCQRNQRTVKTEHIAVTVDDGTTYRPLSPEKTPIQI